ncbi:MAG: hypothetical protein M1825_006445 [Sarcosagium campestre]|nr:MAG: hypothetical protein M1825_006445 [Sarcosagium campestre]
MALIPHFSRAKLILLTAHLAAENKVSALHDLLIDAPNRLDLELFLRILLTFLPETSEPSTYVPLLQFLIGGSPVPQISDDLDVSAVQELSEESARRQVRRLHLHHLALSSSTSSDQPIQFLAGFLIQRARRIDSQSGLLALLPPLFTPFLDLSLTLQIWFTSTVLPLLRLYHDDGSSKTTRVSLAEFESLEKHTKIFASLSGRSERGYIADDLRGVLSPWIWGGQIWKQRETQSETLLILHTPSWQDVYDWIAGIAEKRFDVAVEAFEGWEGPEDVDFGGYLDPKWVEDDEVNSRRQLYASNAMRVIYSRKGASEDVLKLSERLLLSIASRLNVKLLPELDNAIISIPSISDEAVLSGSDFAPERSPNIFTTLERPVLTPTANSLSLLQAYILSAACLARFGQDVSVAGVADLQLQANAQSQKQMLQKLIQFISGAPKSDSRFWLKARDDLLWLYSWQNQGSRDDEQVDSPRGKGILGLVGRPLLEREFLKALLARSEWHLAVEIYLKHAKAQPLLDRDAVEKIVSDSALHFYDNATNGNRSRGGMKKASDTIAAFFPGEFPDSRILESTAKLIEATHALSFYSLTLQHGVPFQPVNIRVAHDPILLLGKVLEQNRGSYTKLDDLVRIGLDLLEARRLSSSASAQVQPGREPDETRSTAERRILAMAIEAALAEDDFETAYSYALNRLSPPFASSQAATAQQKAGMTDDISWRATFQAGRHRSSRSVLHPPKLVSKVTNPEIRHLEMRMELLSQALLLAPAVALSEILGVWRRCEEEMNVLYSQETEEEQRWDDKGDRKIPGQFISPPSSQAKRSSSIRASGDEAPMGLFDVARGAASALSKSAFPLSGLTGAGTAKVSGHRANRSSAEGSGTESITGSEDGRVRKRDMVSNMVSGGLASGIGWVLGATPVQDQQSEGPHDG